MPDHLGLPQITRIIRITSSDHQVVQWIRRVVFPSGLLRITPYYSHSSDSLGLLRFTSDNPGLLGLPVRITKWFQRITRVVYPSGLRRIMPDHLGLLRITPDYQSGSPSGPADYQSFFPLAIGPIIFKFTHQLHVYMF